MHSPGIDNIDRWLLMMGDAGMVLLGTAGALRAAEQNYSQIEQEATQAVFGCTIQPFSRGIRFTRCIRSQVRSLLVRIPFGQAVKPPTNRIKLFTGTIVIHYGNSEIYILGGFPPG
jgi:hypothetical protein